VITPACSHPRTWPDPASIHDEKPETSSPALSDGLCDQGAPVQFELHERDERVDGNEHRQLATTADKNELDFHACRAQLISQFERAYVQLMLELPVQTITDLSKATGISRRHIRSLLQRHGGYSEILQRRLQSLLTLGPDAPCAHGAHR
jgi:DNA-binding NtrC family response regulator